MKIIANVDRMTCRCCSTLAARAITKRLVQQCFDFYMIESKPEDLVGDRAYDSDPLKRFDVEKRGAALM